jgi:hypothetical protein
MSDEKGSLDRRLIEDAFEQTLAHRAQFERLDLKSVESAVSILRDAVKLARDHPNAFFSGFPAPSPAQSTETPPIGGSQQTQERPRTPSHQLDGLLDFLKAQKEYWGGRDDTGQENINYDVPHWSTSKRNGRWRLDIQLNPPPGPDDSVEFFNPRTGEKLGDMTAMPLGHFIGSVGPESGVGSGDSVEVRVNDVPVQTMPLR